MKNVLYFAESGDIVLFADEIVFLEGSYRVVINGNNFTYQGESLAIGQVDNAPEDDPIRYLYQNGTLIANPNYKEPFNPQIAYEDLRNVVDQLVLNSLGV